MGTTCLLLKYLQQEGKGYRRRGRGGGREMEREGRDRAYSLDCGMFGLRAGLWVEGQVPLDWGGGVGNERQHFSFAFSLRCPHVRLGLLPPSPALVLLLSLHSSSIPADLYLLLYFLLLFRCFLLLPLLPCHILCFLLLPFPPSCFPLLYSSPPPFLLPNCRCSCC